MLEFHKKFETPILKRALLLIVLLIVLVLWTGDTMLKSCYVAWSCLGGYQHKAQASKHVFAPLSFCLFERTTFCTFYGIRRGCCLRAVFQSVFSPGPMYLTASQGILHTYTDGHSGEKSNKGNQCDYARNLSVPRAEPKIWRKIQKNWRWYITSITRS